MSGEELAVIVLAAGSSSRMGGIKKEFQKLNANLTVLGSAVQAFVGISSIKRIVIAVGNNTEYAARQALTPRLLFLDSPKIYFVKGGDTRSDSVFNALNFLADHDQQYVLIHDGARPWVSPLLIEKTIEAVKKHDAVIPLLTLTETPKEVGSRKEEVGSEEEEQVVFIKKHLKRVDVGIAQTPQAFKFPEILEAYKKALLLNEEFTDDAEIWDRFVGTVAVIPGEVANRKITFKEDLN